MLSIVTRVLASVCCLCVVVPAEAALVSRLGGAAAYDDVLDITWITNPSLSGPREWDALVAWAAGLDYLGFEDWRLASMSVAAGVPTGTTFSVVDCSSASPADCQENELGYMFYHNLSGTSGDNLTGYQTVDGVALTHIQSIYWSGTDYDSLDAWSFVFGNGLQGDRGKGGDRYGWAVRSGDVAAVVPVPGAFVLLCSALAGLLGFGWRKRRL